jgi:pimeloyl-ACP methyl ester carboxylesterase
MARILDAAERLARFAMNRRGFESRWVTSGTTHLHAYEARGQGPLPTTVMLHGLGSAAAPFGAVLGRLRPHVKRVLAPELPGHGFSAYPGSRMTPDVALDALTHALDGLLTEPSIVCGNSLGGAVALHYAMRRPERVRGLVLLSPAGARLSEDEWRELKSAFRIQTRADAQRLIDRVYHRPPWFLALFAHEFPEAFRRPAVRDLLDSATNDHAPTPDDLASLQMPVLLLWGRSERLLPASALEYFRTHLPAHAVIEEPEGFGHSPHLDEPARVAERILRFVRDVDRGLAPTARTPAQTA